MRLLPLLITIFAVWLLPAFVNAQALLPIAGSRSVVVTDTVWSQSLSVKKLLRVYLPPSYQSDTSKYFPVVFYLHEEGGNENDWVNKGGINRVMDSLIGAGHAEAIIVMPDGDDSWYTTWHSLPDQASCRADRAREEKADTYCVAWPRYDDYIAHDLVGYVDSSYRTLGKANRRAVAGTGMGGHGSLSLAFRYPDVFGVVASHAPSFPVSGFSAVVSGRLVSVFGRDSASISSRDPESLLNRLSGSGAVIPLVYLVCGSEGSFIALEKALSETIEGFEVSEKGIDGSLACSPPYSGIRLSEVLVWILGAMGGALTSSES